MPRRHNEFGTDAPTRPGDAPLVLKDFLRGVRNGIERAADRIDRRIPTENAPFPERIAGDVLRLARETAGLGAGLAYDLLAHDRDASRLSAFGSTAASAGPAGWHDAAGARYAAAKAVLGFLGHPDRRLLEARIAERLEAVASRFDARPAPDRVSGIAATAIALAAADAVIDPETGMPDRALARRVFVTLALAEAALRPLPRQDAKTVLRTLRLAAEVTEARGSALMQGFDGFAPETSLASALLRLAPQVSEG